MKVKLLCEAKIPRGCVIVTESNPTVSQITVYRHLMSLGAPDTILFIIRSVLSNLILQSHQRTFTTVCLQTLLIQSADHPLIQLFRHLLHKHHTSRLSLHLIISTDFFFEIKWSSTLARDVLWYFNLLTCSLHKRIMMFFSFFFYSMPSFYYSHISVLYFRFLLLQKLSSYICFQ